MERQQRELASWQLVLGGVRGPCKAERAVSDLGPFDGLAYFGGAVTDFQPLRARRGALADRRWWKRKERECRQTVAALSGVTSGDREEDTPDQGHRATAAASIQPPENK
ncbi:hypothetical protein H101_07973 [Trichophyton interdigitale H6]|nr:hypothetical protein H101_07973 [Trichophyton interdigitale H6]